jgi:hypothetical protein
MKIVSVLLGIMLVLVGAAAIHFSREADAARQQVADLKAQLEQREAERVSVSATLGAGPVAARADPAASATIAAVPSAPPSRPASAIAPTDISALLRSQMSSPEAVARRKQLARTLMETANPYVGEALGLAPEEADKLLDLLAAHQEGMSAVFSTAAEGGGPANVQERSAALQQRQQANLAELQAMLGSKYPQWEDYQQTRPAWQQLRDLRAVADAAGNPLTDAQGKSLVAALSVEQRNFSQQSREAASQGTSISEILVRHSPQRRQQMLDVAAAHLSPQQLEGYRGMLERAAAQEQNTLRLLESARSAAAAAAAPPQ